MPRTGEVDFAKAARLEAIRSWAERDRRGPAAAVGGMPRRGPPLVAARPTGLAVVSPAMVNASGQVPCLRRMMDGMARDRCFERQRKEGCRCELAAVVREAVRLNRRWEAEYERRREGGRAAPGRALNPSGTRYPPWKLVCAYRKCRKKFEVPRHFGHKPLYHSVECMYAEGRARRRDREAALLGITPRRATP